uniref:Bile salt export pump n=1 Tax=Leptocylindrus danicus TaxID=163516 RepID=A0A7S2L570_9STRA|mmetsp:Transcript_31861/g.46323  ORF Transcript_31861/g.46323 Transcript_31861/m.46323 type:complete len:1322 (+) Transcript_31861:228-4193(+)|eukprot:CAMPEP_0116025064 /NCGR_PEP_ID=MMETSP0321-20121206/12765_1 /TAXON_ID=163516 /ORGANISM="Leptocylindrus danicus var. danicus, Strain B650" /LENGTH=1321 /DNA_ID=CAMNT_0003497065 /DNA_START=144 /DNA_END=4109 /DNA_ORIENTATION=+
MAERDGKKRDDDTPPKIQAASIRDTLSFGSGPKKNVCIAVGSFFAMASGAALPAEAAVFAKIFENLSAATSGDDFLEKITELAYAFMAIGAVMLVGMTIQTALFEIAATEMTNSMKTQWFEALLRQDMAYFDIEDVSGTASIISSSAAAYRKGTGRKLAEGVQFLTTVVGGFAYAFYASWRTSLIMFAVSPIMVIPLILLTRLNETRTTRANDAYAKAGSVAYSTVSSIRTVLSLNACEVCIDKFKSATLEAYVTSTKLAGYEGFVNGFMMGAFILSYVALTLYGAYLLYDDVRSSGCDPSATDPTNSPCDPSASDVFGAMFGVTFSASVLPQVGNAIAAFSKARVACAPALRAINRRLGSDASPAKSNDSSTSPDLPKYEIDSSSPEGLKPDITGTIEFKNVKFHYPSRPESNVFDDFNLSFEAGKTVAIVGPSGSGKSTVTALLERFYDVTSGLITIDGINIKDINVKHLRSQIGFVQQEPVLFATTIANNIAFGCPGATQEEIEEAAKQANAHDFIMSFPNGYNTQVGDKGTQISGGQKQRIAIARVLVRNPKILILDEATSALDSESELLVQQALDKQMFEMNRTTIVIAHRLSTIRDADMIAVVEGGCIVETGNHVTLLEANGAYKRLVDAQTQSKSNPETPVDSASNSRSTSMLNLNEAGEGEEVEFAPLLAFRDVSFAYPTRPENIILNEFNLSIRQGETLAIVGPSGGGKSTVLSLIERFYDPLSGSVELDGVDLKELNVKWLRFQMGFVQQEPVLFNTTIGGNISFSKPGTSIDDIQAAAKQANAHDFIVEFPDGYNTYVGEKGSQLSGGQKQRVAIARAVLNKPKILLLDEATSALDSESEQVVQNALDELMAMDEQTVIVIAHRLSTIRNADRIAVIDGGKVKEIGNHEQLIAKPHSQYRRLVEMQSLGIAKKETSIAKKDEEDEMKDKNDDVEEGSSAVKDDETAKKKKVIDEALKAKKKRAKSLSKPDLKYLLIGGVGAGLSGLLFPGWGVIFANMVDMLFRIVPGCTKTQEECDAIYDAEAEDIEQESYDVTYQWFIIIALTLVGNILLFYGFGMATERMTKRVRDQSFESLVRQEVSFFDSNDVGGITTQLQEDTSVLHAFSGDPVRTLMSTITSVFLGLVVSFFFMWPFALLVMGILPVMAWQAEMEMKMYLGEDQGEDTEHGAAKSGAVGVETLLNMRTVAALSMESKQQKEYVEALHVEAPESIKAPVRHGFMGGLGGFVQNWGIALMFWWGGYLLVEYPSSYDFRDFNISMFALLFGLSGVGIAAQGAADRDKAEIAVERIFDLIDRKSSIDPMINDGKRGS